MTTAEVTSFHQSCKRLLVPQKNNFTFDDFIDDVFLNPVNVVFYSDIDYILFPVFIISPKVAW